MDGVETMKGRIIAIAIIAILIIAGLAYYTMAKDNTWVDPWPPGESAGGSWGERLIITYEDGHTEVVNDILNNNNPLTVSYNGGVVSQITYELNGKATQGGSDYNEVIVDFQGGALQDQLISSSGYVAAWDFDSNGVINSVDMATITAHYQETGAPGWIPQDLNYDGTVNYVDVSLFTTHVGATTGSGMLSQYYYTTKTGNNTIQIDNAWHSLYSATLRLSAYNNQPDASYVVQLKMTGGTPKYRGHSTAGSYYSNWVNVNYPTDRNIIITVGHGSLTFIFGTGVGSVPG